MANGKRPGDEVVRKNIIEWNIPQPDRDYTVVIHCSTYNHGKYIKDALEGFVNQKCSYSFCAIVIDDGSSDNAPAIIREYTEKYPEIIKPILLGVNHMQHGVLREPYFEKWHQCAKYIAFCEGDDYWTDPLKLQKQVKYMEEHPDCCMTACAANWEKDGEIVKNDRICEESRDLTTEEVILGGGGYLATCSLVYDNAKLNKEVPKWRKIANVGDYPLQIQGTLEGKLHYFPEIMCVYRCCTEGSWTNTYLMNDKKLMQIHRQKEVIWMKELDRDTNFKFQNAICQRLKPYIPQLYLQRMVHFKDYLYVVYVVGNKHYYKRMFKDIIKRIFNYHCEE